MIPSAKISKLLIFKLPEFSDTLIKNYNSGPIQVHFTIGLQKPLVVSMECQLMFGLLALFVMKC